MTYRLTDSVPGLYLYSAGVGRSGTYVTIDTLLNAIEANKSIDVNSTVRKLRMKRMRMVQSVVSMLMHTPVQVAMVTVVVIVDAVHSYS